MKRIYCKKQFKADAIIKQIIVYYSFNMSLVCQYGLHSSLNYIDDVRFIVLVIGIFVIDFNGFPSKLIFRFASFPDNITLIYLDSVTLPYRPTPRQLP